MSDTALKMIAPAFGTKPHSDAEAFGSAVWLWMHSRTHCQAPLLALDHLLLPAIRLGQYALFMDESAQASSPVGYVSWANLSPEAEARYLNNSVHGLTAADWNSGDRMWFIHLFAPFGHCRKVFKRTTSMMANASGRYMYHHSNEQGINVRTFTGAKVDPVHAQQWWGQRPMLAVSSLTTAASQQS